MSSTRIGRLARSGALWAAALGQAGCLGGSARAVGAAAAAPTPADGVAPGAPPCAPPPATPMLRLTQAHYRAAVRSLLGVTDLGALVLPVDQQVGPFGANADAPLTDLGVDQYMVAAEAVAAAALPNLPALLPCPVAALDATCMARLVARLGRQAHRRPLTADEQAQYEALAAAPLQAGDPNGAVSLVIEAMLQSPSFLYRPELGDPAAAASTGGAVALTSYELATRLAFMLTGAPPDDALLQAAADGFAADADAVAAQASRLATGAPFAAAMADFVSQWLGLQGLPQSSRDPALYPGFTPALLAAMQQETADFVGYVLGPGDGRLETLLAAPYSVLSEPLFALYGVARPPGWEIGQRVDLDPTQRGGLLLQAAFLTAQAHPNMSAPVRRGRVVRENLLCQSLPPPPPNVPALPAALPANATARQIFASHESNPSCAGCHVLMDPLGLTFENYDAIGAWRTQQGGSAIDASGQIAATPSTDGPVADAVALAAALAHSADVRLCLASQALTYGTARRPAADDRCAVDALATAFEGSGHSLRALMLGVATADTFRRVAAAGAP